MLGGGRCAKHRAKNIISAGGFHAELGERHGCIDPRWWQKAGGAFRVPSDTAQGETVGLVEAGLQIAARARFEPAVDVYKRQRSWRSEGLRGDALMELSLIHI